MHKTNLNQRRTLLLVVLTHVRSASEAVILRLTPKVRIDVLSLRYMPSKARCQIIGSAAVLPTRSSRGRLAT
jgi:hypothetical protein